MFCTQCGMAIAEQDSFCTACGTAAPVSGPKVALSGELRHKKPLGKAWKRILILVAVVFFVYVLGVLAWQFLHFAKQSGRAEMEQQISQVGTCVTELNGFYHCAQDKFNAAGTKIQLRQCRYIEVVPCWQTVTGVGFDQLLPEKWYTEVSVVLPSNIPPPSSKLWVEFECYEAGFDRIENLPLLRCPQNELDGGQIRPLRVQFEHSPVFGAEGKWTCKFASENDLWCLEQSHAAGGSQGVGAATQGEQVQNRNGAQAQSQPATASVPSAGVFSPSGQMAEKKFGEYTIRIYSGSSDQLAGGFLEILQAGTRVYTGQHESFEIDDTGTPVGADVTGTGNPNLVVKEYSGGAHCCTSFEVFSLGSNFQKLVTIESADCDGAHFQRQDNGGYVFYGCDPAVRMYGASFADSAAPGVILRYVNGSFHLAPDLMRKPPPSLDELKAKAADLASNPTWSTQDVPGAFWQCVIDLTYSGNSRSADQFVTLAWPVQRTDRNQQIQQFSTQLRKSPYWADIQALNLAQ